MASNKNQHFVPKVYLRRFSNDPEEASIHLFNLSRRRSLHQASIKGQCSSNYFYGEKNKYEDLLQTYESFYGLFVADLEAGTFRLGDDEARFLRHFVFLQHNRAEAFALHTAAYMNGMANLAFDENPPAEYVSQAKETSQMAIESFEKSQYLIEDLKVRLVRNRTSVDFIASDNPAVQANRWHQQNPKARHKAPGISSAGVMFFMPVTPRYLCVLYDGDVYTADNAAGIVDLTRAEDVHALNEHQFLNCQSNVYFQQWTAKDDVAARYELVADRRPAARYELITAILEKEDAWGQEFKVVPATEARKEGKALIHTKAVFAVPSRWPSFLRIRNTPKIYSNGTGTGFVRAWSLKHRVYSGTGYKKVK